MPSYSAFAASLALQFAMIASLGNRSKLATLLCAVSAAIVAWQFHFDNQRLRRRTLLAVAAIAVAILSLPTFWVMRSGSGGGSYVRVAAAQPSERRTKAPEPRDATGSGGTHDGVILWPKIEPKPIVFPPMSARRPNAFSKSDSQPLTIPFDGVYWIFKRPDTKPPPNSITAHGSPVEMSFTSTDFRPLTMEAHQNLARRIDLQCCSQIQVAVTNSDWYPGSISLELILIDTLTAGKPSASLGRVPVTSSSEVLTFAIPAHLPIVSFDEIAIHLHLTPWRSTRSPRIAIERFTFVPRT